MYMRFCFKGELKAHIYVSLYESNTLQEYTFSLSDPMRGEFCVLPAASASPKQPLVAAMFFNCYQL